MITDELFDYCYDCCYDENGSCIPCENDEGDSDDGANSNSNGGSEVDSEGDSEGDSQAKAQTSSEWSSPTINYQSNSYNMLLIEYLTLQ